MMLEIPVRQRKVRKDLIAYQYANGCVVIGEMRYYLYSLSDAIRKYRQDYPIRRGHDEIKRSINK
jgi:hypothetical protein